MDSDLAVRLALVLVAAAAVAGVARFRIRRRAYPLRLEEGNLPSPGIYLFTAAECDACDSARTVYERVLGKYGFVEHTWENDPDLLTRLAVAEIPLGVVLDVSGREVASFVGVPPRFGLWRATRKVASTRKAVEKI